MRGRPPKLHLSRSQRIWADSEACTPGIRDALFAMADRRRVVLTLVSTKAQQWPHSAFIRSIVVSEGFDGVSARLQQLAMEGDVVVSADARLLRELAARKITALPPRDTGERAAHLDRLLAETARQAAANLAVRQRKPSEAAADAG